MLVVSALISTHVVVFSASKSLVCGSDAGFLDKASGAWLRVPLTHVAVVCHDLGLQALEPVGFLSRLRR